MKQTLLQMGIYLFALVRGMEVCIDGDGGMIRLFSARQKLKYLKAEMDILQNFFKLALILQKIITISQAARLN